MAKRQRFIKGGKNRRSVLLCHRLFYRRVCLVLVSRFLVDLEAESKNGCSRTYCCFFRVKIIALLKFLNCEL